MTITWKTCVRRKDQYGMSMKIRTVTMRDIVEACAELLMCAGVEMAVAE